MFCYCRFLRRVLPSNSWTSLYCIQSAFSSQVRTQFSAAENNEIILQEKPISPHLVQEIKSLEFFWKKQKNGIRFKSLVFEYFSKNEGSSSSLVELLRAACDKFKCSPDLVYSLLSNLDNAIHENGVDFSPSFQEKKELLRLVIRYRNFQLLHFACKVFKIDKGDHSFKEFIDDLIERDKVVEAANLIGVLNLHHEYAIEEILFSLILTGKFNVVRSCIENHPDLQLTIAKKLDSLLVTEEFSSSLNKPSMDSRKIVKGLNKIVNSFKIPTENCKNLYYIRSRGAINMLIKRRNEQSVSDEAWEGMVMSIIGENTNLKEHLIYKLIQQNNKETALKMIEMLNMNDFDVSKLNHLAEREAKFENIADKDDLEEDSNEQLMIEESSAHLTFSLSTSDVKFIDTEEKFTDFINDIMNYKIVGIDSEWKPSFGLASEKLALIQLAVYDKVYILDMLSLNECLTAKHWDKLMENVFGSSAIIKLGCGIMSDVQMIVDSHQGTKGKKIRFSHILDMAIFYEKLQDIYPDEMNDDSNIDTRKNKGLSKLCEIILGQPLNKEERLCDWEKRPLTESQLEYAALDAYCLVQMYDKLKDIADEKSMNFDHLVTVAMFTTTNQWKPKKKLIGTKTEKVLQIGKPIPLEQFKVVIDSELEAQGKQLRQLRVEVLILENSCTPEAAVEIAKSEERILICGKLLFHKVQRFYPDAFYFRPINRYGDHIPISSILHKFNVQFNMKNLLFRCEVCNSKEGIKVSSANVKFLQECVESQDFNVSNLKEESSDFQKTLSDMIKSGIHIKLKNQNKDSHIDKSQAFLCTKCGTVQ